MCLLFSRRITIGTPPSKFFVLLMLGMKHFIKYCLIYNVSLPLWWLLIGFLPKRIFLMFPICVLSVLVLLFPHVKVWVGFTGYMVHPYIPCPRHCFKCQKLTNPLNNDGNSRYIRTLWKWLPPFFPVVVMLTEPLHRITQCISLRVVFWSSAPCRSLTDERLKEEGCIFSRIYAAFLSAASRPTRVPAASVAAVHSHPLRSSSCLTETQIICLAFEFSGDTIVWIDSPFTLQRVSVLSGTEVFPDNEDPFSFADSETELASTNCQRIVEFHSI